MGRTGVAVCAVVAGTSWFAAGAAGQEGATSFGLGFGLFDGYPSEFEGFGCDGRHGGFTARLGRVLSGPVTLEGDVTWTGSVGSTECIALGSPTSLPAPTDGTTYVLISAPEALEGETFVASRLAAVVRVWRSGPVTARARLAGGRIWDKELWTWTAGPGVRLALGRHAVALDAERWHLGYDLRRETFIYREAGPDELQGAEILERRPTPWLVRLSWELTLGE